MLEILNPQNTLDAPRVRVAVFDFDDTLSRLREGWPQIMADLMLDELLKAPKHEGEAKLRVFIADVIHATTGQQTIYQMIRLTDEVTRRGGTPDTPQAYLQVFSERLLACVRERVAAIESGVTVTGDWLVPGSVALLTALRARDITCYIASGTGEEFVRAEAAVLGIAPFFAGIFGAHADYKNHSKKAVIGRIVAQHNLRAGELVAFGDGVPEIVDTKAVNGIAIGVVGQEPANGGINSRKRAALTAAGADIIVPDFREHEELVAYLFPKVSSVP